MASLLDEIVITDGNKAAFEPILSIMEPHDKPIMMYVWGPEASGKSTVLRARSREKDLLSTGKAVTAHVGEIIAALSTGVNDGLLNMLGEADVAMIDGFEQLANEGPTGEDLPKFLIGARREAGLDTVIASRVPIEELNIPDIQDVLQDFQVVEIKPLDDQGKRQFAKQLQDNFLSTANEEDRSAKLSDDVLAYIANDFATDMSDIRNAVQYLTTQLTGQERVGLTRESVAEILAS